jgi:hypothetical protein
MGARNRPRPALRKLGVGGYRAARERMYLVQRHSMPDIVLCLALVLTLCAHRAGPQAPIATIKQTPESVQRLPTLTGEWDRVDWEDPRTIADLPEAWLTAGRRGGRPRMGGFVGADARGVCDARDMDGLVACGQPDAGAHEAPPAAVHDRAAGQRHGVALRGPDGLGMRRGERRFVAARRAAGLGAGLPPVAPPPTRGRWGLASASGRRLEAGADGSGVGRCARWAQLWLRRTRG